MPGPPKGAKTTEPLDTQGSNSKVPIHLTRSVSASAKAASDNSSQDSESGVGVRSRSQESELGVTICSKASDPLDITEEDLFDPLRAPN